MKTLLDSSAQKKLSPKCRRALRDAQADTVFHALLRPAPKSVDDSDPLSPEPIDKAIRSAGDAYGQGHRLVRDLQAALREKTQSLRTWVPNATELWLADALAVTLPAVELAKLSHRQDVRSIDLQPTLSPARRTAEHLDWADFSEPLPENSLHLELMEGPRPRIGLIDLAPVGLDSELLAEASFDELGLPNLGFSTQDPSAKTWQSTLFEVIPQAQWLRAGVFDGHRPSTYSQIVAGLQWTLEQGADLVVLDLGAAALDPIWNLPILNCTLYGTSVIVAGMKRNQEDKPLWPVHIPLAGCYDRGPLRTDLLISGAPLGRQGLTGALAAATRIVAAVTLLQTVAPKLRNDPAALVGPLFAGANRGAAPLGEVEWDPESMLKAVHSAA